MKSFNQMMYELHGSAVIRYQGEMTVIQFNHAIDRIMAETNAAFDALAHSTALAIDRVSRWDQAGIPFALIAYPSFGMRQDFPVPDYMPHIDFGSPPTPSYGKFGNGLDYSTYAQQQANYTGHAQLRGPVTGGIFGDLFGFEF